ncbi:metallophosphoesterase [bacterium]|nr:metallophosphoesterase [bacterium]
MAVQCNCYFYRIRRFIPVLIVFLSVSRCIRDKTIQAPEPPGASLSFTVFSDPHYYDPGLGTAGEAFGRLVAGDRKMVAESHAIMEETVRLIQAEDVEIVLVAGDMTNNGERLCHEKVASFLGDIEQDGKKVYVIPGNHDINNPYAYRYPESGDPVPVESVTPEEFETMYHEFGYGEAIDRDSVSLSYVARPKEGVWILAVDACHYGSEYTGTDRVAGHIREATREWMLTKLDEARIAGITVLGLMHHGLVEHFAGMSLIFSQYLVQNWRDHAAYLADSGLKIMFTGHFHSSDISDFRDDGFIFDVQCGSTVTWPCPVRLAFLDGQSHTLSLETRLIRQINYNTGGDDFQTYAKKRLLADLSGILETHIREAGLNDSAIAALLPDITSTMLAYVHGDESELEHPVSMTHIHTLQSDPDLMIQLLGFAMESIWTDPTPDNDAVIGLRNGNIEKIKD